MTKPRSAFWASLATLALATAVGATEGRIEINHARALEGGITAEDAPGYPVTISESGSYRLTGNLTVPDENTHGIEVTTVAPSTVLLVSLDLAGFEIAGPTVCTAGVGSVSCSPTGTGDGVVSAAGHLLRVSNGTIRGVGGQGLVLQSNGVASGLRVSSTGSEGITSGSGVTIANCDVSATGGSGISTVSGGLLLDNRVADSDSVGILVAGTGTLVSGNSVSGSRVSAGVASIQTNVGLALIVDNKVRDSAADGINLSVAAPSSVAGLVSHNTISGSVGDGVQTIRGALLLDNAIMDSGSFGVHHTNSALQGFPPDVVGYGRNTMEGNSGNVFDQPSINPPAPIFSTDLGGNACEGGC